MNVNYVLGYLAVGFFLVAGAFIVDYLRHGDKASFMRCPVWITLIMAAVGVILWLGLAMTIIAEHIMEDEGPF